PCSHATSTLTPCSTLFPYTTLFRSPVNGAFAKLESRRTDGFFCESWSPTNDRGVAVLPPIHMGKLMLIVKAKGYQTIKIEVPTDSLSEPIHVTLHKK